MFFVFAALISAHNSESSDLQVWSTPCSPALTTPQHDAEFRASMSEHRLQGRISGPMLIWIGAVSDMSMGTQDQACGSIVTPSEAVIQDETDSDVLQEVQILQDLCSRVRYPAT
jgi:hypothetical protein